MKKLRVTVEGKSYDVVVEILDESPSPAALAAAPAPAAISAPVVVGAAIAPAAASTRGAAPAQASPGDVTSPLSGKLVSIDVKVGQVIDEGIQVATIEAMKMNTYIFAPKGGRVTAVLGNPGDGVEEGAVLLQIG